MDLFSRIGYLRIFREDIFSRVLRFKIIFFTHFYFFNSISLFLIILTGVQTNVSQVVW